MSIRSVASNTATRMDLWDTITARTWSQVAANMDKASFDAVYLHAQQKADSATRDVVTQVRNVTAKKVGRHAR